MAIGSALFYTFFILASDRVAEHTPPVPFAASVATGAAVTFGVAALIDGGISASGEGVMWAAVIASVSTVMPIVLFMAGLARVGPSTASIASTIEPPFTVALAWIVFGETLGPLQLVGGAFVLSAVVLLQLRAACDQRSDGRRRSARQLPARAGRDGSRAARRLDEAARAIGCQSAHHSDIGCCTGRQPSPPRRPRAPDLLAPAAVDVRWARSARAMRPIV